jgi:hypothetical protein
MAHGMRTWIDDDWLGAVERLGEDVVVTEFFCVVVPVWPRRSVYVQRSPDGDRRIDLRLHPTSVATGYLRTSTWMAALILGLPGLLARDRWAWLLPVGLGLAALAAVLTFGVGRLSPAERARRTLLRKVVGVGAPPEMLPPKAVAATRLWLEGRWQAAHPEPWLDAIAAGVGDELLVALAEYHGRSDLAAEARAALDARDARTFN